MHRHSTEPRRRRPPAGRCPSPTPVTQLDDCSDLASHAKADAPLVKDGMVIRTIEQDAELKDWLTGIMKLSDKNAEEAKAADAAQAKVTTALATANQRADTLQTQIDALQKAYNDAVTQLNAALAKIAHILRQNGIMALVIAGEAALLALLIVLKLKLAEVQPPWIGMAIVFGAPIVAFGATEAFLRWIL